MSETDVDEVARILRMSANELFGYVMDNPEFLTNHYYRVLGDAMRKRFEELQRTT